MANVRLHKSDAGLLAAISTNATTEEDFLVSIADVLQHELAELEDGRPHIAALFGILLGRALPMTVEVCCKLRGYKADVAEHRVIVAGRVTPEDVVGAFQELESQV